jgi:hypothetical protein
MRRFMRVRWLGVALLVVAGCRSTEAEVKPKERPEELVAPPDQDPRYNSHINYPKETLFNDVIKKGSTQPDDQAKPPRMGMGTNGRPGAPGAF